MSEINSLVYIASYDHPDLVPIFVVQHVSNGYQVAFFMLRVFSIGVDDIRDGCVDFVGNFISLRVE